MKRLLALVGLLAFLSLPFAQAEEKKAEGEKTVYLVGMTGVT